MTVKTETTCFTNHASISFAITTTLSDYDQLVIDVPKSEHKFVNGSWQTVDLGTEKFRVEKLNYNFTGRGENQMGITSLSGRGFTKAGTLKVRDSTVFSLTQETTNQIPIHYHNLAIEQYVKNAEFLSTRIAEIQNNGLSLTGRRNV
jgi:ribosomal protein L31